MKMNELLYYISAKYQSQIIQSSHFIALFSTRLDFGAEICFLASIMSLDIFFAGFTLND